MYSFKKCYPYFFKLREGTSASMSTNVVNTVTIRKDLPILKSTFYQHPANLTCEFSKIFPTVNNIVQSSKDKSQYYFKCSTKNSFYSLPCPTFYWGLPLKGYYNNSLIAALLSGTNFDAESLYELFTETKSNPFIRNSHRMDVCYWEI